MKTYAIYQIQANRINKKIEVSLEHIADYEIKETSPYNKDKTDIENRIWHLCNVSEWDDKYEPGTEDYISIEEDGIIVKNITNKFYGYASSDLIVEIDNGYQVAEPFGWGREITLADAVEHVLSKHVIYSPHKDYIIVKGLPNDKK